MNNDNFFARVDCKAHRKEGILEIIHLHFEESFMYIDVFASLFSKEMKKYYNSNIQQTLTQKVLHF